MQLYSADGVRQERTGWRCQDISERHRLWGFDCPAVDLDFVMAEYNHGKPVAIIEYKERHAAMPRFNHPTYLALTDLADNRLEPLPFMVAFYDPIEWWFQVIPVNEKAKEYCSGAPAISEQQFVRALYSLRKKVLTEQDEKVFARLSKFVPQVAT